MTLEQTLPLRQVINGDCIEVMKEWPEVCIDLIITDPPYGLDFHDNEWDRKIPNWLIEARRISRVVIFTTAPTTQWDYPKPDWVGCWYRNGSTARNIYGGFNHWTPVLFYGKIRLMIDSISLPSASNIYPSHYPHPSPKPLALMEWLVQSCTNENDIVLDPFLGSGTTAVACEKLRRKWIGIEINKDYCDIAKKRLEPWMNQSRLHSAEVLGS